MGNVKFIEKTHQYLSPQGEMISVSKFLDRFKEKVDWTQIAKDSAAKMRKNGIQITTQQLLAKWANKRDRAAEIGTLYHTIREDELLGSENPSYYNVKCSIKGCTYEGVNKHSLNLQEIENNHIYPELMIYDYDYMICGQSDKVIVANRTINIWDYKTDAEIKFKGFTSKWKPTATKLLSPLKHLDDVNGYHYAIKMSLYMYLLWKANHGKFKPGEIIIEHVHLKRDPENDNLPIIGEDGRPIVLKIEKIKLPYLKKEVIDMLKTLKK
jgi:hypothetical protein